MNTQNLEYIGKIAVYCFVGDRIPPPQPGSYDPKHYTPPTHKTYRVEFEGSNWQLYQNQMLVKSGFGNPSFKDARQIVRDWIRYAAQLGQLSDSESESSNV